MQVCGWPAGAAVASSTSRCACCASRLACSVPRRSSTTRPRSSTASRRGTACCRCCRRRRCRCLASPGMAPPHSFLACSTGRDAWAAGWVWLLASQAKPTCLGQRTTCTTAADGDCTVPHVVHAGVCGPAWQPWCSRLRGGPAALCRAALRRAALRRAALSGSACLQWSKSLAVVKVVSGSACLQWSKSFQHQPAPEQQCTGLAQVLLPTKPPPQKGTGLGGRRTSGEALQLQSWAGMKR